MRTWSWKRWAVVVLTAVLVLVVGGPFVYIHFIEGKAPAPLALSTPSTPVAAAADPSGSIDGVWKVTSGSRAGYRVQETLFGQSNTAVGRTSGVSGTFTLQGTSITAGTFTVDMTTVASDRSQRDHQFQGRIMDTAAYPTATFTLTAPIQLGSVPSDGTTISATATGNLNLRGASRAVTFPVQARRSGSSIQVSGSIPVVFADWNIPNPSFDFVTTQDHGVVEFALTFVYG